MSKIASLFYLLWVKGITSLYIPQGDSEKFALHSPGCFMHPNFNSRLYLPGFALSGEFHTFPLTYAVCAKHLRFRPVSLNRTPSAGKPALPQPPASSVVCFYAPQNAHKNSGPHGPTLQVYHVNHCLSTFFYKIFIFVKFVRYTDFYKTFCASLP